MCPLSAADEVVLVSDEEPASRFWFHRKSWEYHSVQDWSCFSGIFISGTALDSRWSHLTWCAVILFNVIIDIPDPYQSGMWHIPSALQSSPWLLSNPNIFDLVCTRVAALAREQMVVWLFIILFLIIRIRGRRGSQDVGPQYHANKNRYVYLISPTTDITHYLIVYYLVLETTSHWSQPQF